MPSAPFRCHRRHSHQYPYPLGKSCFGTIGATFGATFGAIGATPIYIYPLGELVQPLGKFVQPLGKFVQPLGKLVQPLGKLVFSKSR